MPPADLGRMREAAMGDEEFLQELIGLFLHDTPRQIELLQQAVEAQDGISVRLSAHRLKGASANFGARQFFELCRQLEQAGARGNLEQAPALLREMQDEFSRLQDFLTHLQDEKSRR